MTKYKVRLMGYNDAVCDCTGLSTWALSSMAGQAVFIPLWSTLLMTGLATPYFPWWNYPDRKSECPPFVSQSAASPNLLTPPAITTSQGEFQEGMGTQLKLKHDSCLTSKA